MEALSICLRNSKKATAIGMGDKSRSHLGCFQNLGAPSLCYQKAKKVFHTYYLHFHYAGIPIVISMASGLDFPLSKVQKLLHHCLSQSYLC